MDVDIEASNATAGVSLRNGPIREVEVDGRDVGDHGSRSAVKRKVVKPAVKEESGSESDQPLVSPCILIYLDVEAMVSTASAILIIVFN